MPNRLRAVSRWVGHLCVPSPIAGLDSDSILPNSITNGTSDEARRQLPSNVRQKAWHTMAWGTDVPMLVHHVSG